MVQDRVGLTDVVKHFDIGLSWMGKFKNYEKAAFWSADTDEGMYASHNLYQRTCLTKQNASKKSKSPETAAA